MFHHGALRGTFIDCDRAWQRTIRHEFPGYGRQPYEFSGRRLLLNWQIRLDLSGILKHGVHFNTPPLRISLERFLNMLFSY